MNDTPSLSDTGTRPLPEITAEIVDALRALSLAVDDDEATQLRKRVADGFVDARVHFVTDDGRPDWSARTGAYRQWNAEVFAATGLDPAVASTIRGSLRYHIGNVVRDRLTTDELEELGLTVARPRERMAKIRANQTVKARKVGAGASFGSSTEVLEALGVLTATLARVRPDVVAASDQDRAVVVKKLRALAAQANEIADGALL